MLRSPQGHKLRMGRIVVLVMWDLDLSPPSESCRQLMSEMMADHRQRPPTHIPRLATLFHVAGLAVLVNAFRLTSEPDSFFMLMFTKMGGRTHFLTMWGLFFATVTFVLNIMMAIFRKNSRLRDLRKLTLAIGLPLESVITTLYWPIIILNPNMMMLSELELVIPLSVDLALHLYPAVLLWIDYLVFSDRFADSSSRKITLTKDIHLSILQLTLLLTLAYVSRIELLCYFNSDIPLPYPFLNDVDFPVRVAIYSAAAGLCYMYSSIAESLHGLLFRA
ncbi:hypothetical protein PGT21_027073 [Puccinia graminis f. sp. tritici]|uniref:FAR-17a/AIG1-like protein n=1 Tax=Puccinia graminis f. sp. tritici TaxID=56615 RepID=A0A5B0QJN0_PUCGR|nr:hypothetical protein PGT21_027073 [Puccinia graminis f. sp. tritici]